MGKCISFSGKDEELVKKIMAFQKKNDLEHFIDAVRKLCEVGLDFEKTVNKVRK